MDVFSYRSASSIRKSRKLFPVRPVKIASPSLEKNVNASLRSKKSLGSSPASFARSSVLRLPPRPPRSYCRQSRQSPHSAPPPSLPRFFPRKPARTPNSFPQFRFPSPASLLLHRQSKRRAARDASRATPRAASATLPPLSRPAIHRSSYRNTSQNPMLPPRGAPDEANRPFPVSAKRTISGRPRRRVLAFPAFSRL